MHLIKKYRIYIFLFTASFLTIIIHEFGHFLMGTILGYNMGFDFNGTSPLIGTYSNDIDYFLVIFAGIFFTLIQSFFAIYLINKLNYQRLYYLVLTPFLYRLIPYLLSIFYPQRFLLQDEARIGQLLEINLYIIPILIVGILLFNCYRVNKNYQINFNRHLKLSLVSTVSFIIIIRLNQILLPY